METVSCGYTSSLLAQVTDCDGGYGCKEGRNTGHTVGGYGCKEGKNTGHDEKTQEHSKVAMLHSFFRKEPSTGRPQLVQDVVRGGIQRVPPSYVLPTSHRPCLSNVCHTVCPPLVDLADLHGEGRPDSLAKIGRACQQWGFMQVINHGVPQPVIDRMWAAAQRFFELPSDERARLYLADPRNREVAPNATLGWRETLRFTGLWDNSAHLPMFCREPVERYQAEMAALALKLNEAIMETLGVSGANVQAANVSKKGLSMHLYPPCPEPSLTLGIGEHQDITTFTILLETEGVGGLQLMQNGQWVDHKPAPGSLGVILGEQMARLSNGKYPSVAHRVVTNPSKLRMSIATFFLPPPHSKIRPLPHLIDPIHPSLFKELAIADTLPLASHWFN